MLEQKTEKYNNEEIKLKRHLAANYAVHWHFDLFQFHSPLFRGSAIFILN